MSGPFGSSQWMYNSGGSFYDYSIDNSLRFEGISAPSYLSRTFTAGSNTTWTFSWWFKPDNATNNNGTLPYFLATSGDTYIRQQSGENYQIEGNLRGSGGTNYFVSWAPLLRDISAWYHCVFAVDTTQGTSSNRVKFYLNGVQQTTAGSLGLNYPPQNHNTQVNTAVAHRLGANYNAPSSYAFSGYMAEINFVDGTQLDASNFGEAKSGVWIPKEYSGSYGTNGFHLEFAGNANDSSGNGNNWTANNISSYDYVPDSPTNNFPTIIKGYNQNVSQGNLKVERSSNANNHMGYFSTMGMKTGKWYAEVRYVDASIDTVAFGVAETNERFSPSQDLTAYAGGSRSGIAVNTYVDWATYGVEAKKYSTYNTTNTSYGVAGVSGDIFMLAVDMDNNKFWIGKNGTWMASGNPAAGTNPTHEGAAFAPEKEMVFVGSFYAGRATDIRWNFGQDSSFMGAATAQGNTDGNGLGDFYYSPPSDFLALCSQNMPAPAIDPLDDETPEDYFNTVLYTGTGATQSITGVGFQPDWVWLKRRSSSANHTTLDAVRGATKTLEPNVGNAEETQTQSITSFDSDGWTIGSRVQDNQSGGTYVSWNWLAGNGTSSNTDGSITSTVSANTDAGFSVLTWTGTAGTDTIGHGLGTAPSMIITKPLSGDNWIVYHQAMGATNQMYLDLTNGQETNSNIYSTAPTSSVFTIGSWSSTRNLVSFCFAEKEGYSKIGSYTGNGSSDGAFIYTGFRPAWWLVKATTGGEPWMVMDNKRDAYNLNDAQLQAQDSRAETNDGNGIDFLADGIKLRSNIGNWNTNGVKYIYMAFAEQPFKYANAR